jgi:hypothetical protein
MGTTKRPTPKRDAASAKMTLDDMNSLLIYSEREMLAGRYGSLEAARERLDMLEATNQWHRHDGQLPPFIWWATQADVPEDLCQDEDLYIDLTANRDEPWPENAIDTLESLEVVRWRWMADHGFMTDADRREIARLAAQPPRSDRRWQRLAESIGAAQLRIEDSHVD